MKAVAMARFGPPSVLRARSLPVPRPGPGEVLIAVTAAGVGIWDVKMRDGSWGETRTKFPRVIGPDGAGVVAALGPRVRRLQVGQRVWAYQFGAPKGGFYAEYAVVKASNAAAAPAQLSPLEAAAAAVTGLTALAGIEDTLRLRPGQRLLIFGASGAVGTLAVQLARGKGAHVIATATGRAAQALVRRLGAHQVLDARSDHFIARLESLAPDGLDAVLALAGGPALDRCLALVRPSGVVAFPNGIEPEPKPGRRKLSITGYDAEVNPRQLARLGRAAAAGLEVPIAATYPLGRAAAAHRRLEKGGVAGRIVLRVRNARKDG
jgi:NADPH:quinone reductase-like Zn-dependent oxidoreductase